jgi:hypothetical protein
VLAAYRDHPAGEPDRRIDPAFGVCSDHLAKRTLALFDIRGVGHSTISPTLNHATFAQAERLWAIMGLVALLSVLLLRLLHGSTVTPVLRLIDRQQRRNPDRPKASWADGTSTSLN